MLKSCFLGGLKRELKYDVKLLRPTTVHEAISIALQLDAKLNDLKPLNGKHVAFHKPQLQLLPQLAAPRPKVLLYKKLTPKKVQRKKERGECWFCEDKWVRGHKYPHKQLLMLDIVQEDVSEKNEQLDPDLELLQME